MRTIKNALTNLVQTAILNFKMAAKNRVFTSFRLLPRRVRWDCLKYKFISVLYKSLRYLYTSHKSAFSLRLASVGSSTRSGV